MRRTLWIPLVAALTLGASGGEVQATPGEVFVIGGLASGSYGTGSESDVVSTRLVYNTGDTYQLKIDAGWLSVESPLGVLPGSAGPVPVRRRRGGKGPGGQQSGSVSQTSWNDAGPGPKSHQPDTPEIESGSSELQEVSASGVGDVHLALSRRIVGGGAKVFRMDGGVEIKVPTADPDEGLGTGEWDARAGLSSEYRFWSTTAFAGLGWNYFGDPAWAELNDVVDAYGGVESEPLAGRWILSGWMAGNPEVVEGAGSRAVVGFGLRTTGKWRFRLQGTAGLTDGSEDFSALVAVSRGVATPTVGTRGPRR